MPRRKRKIRKKIVIKRKRRKKIVKRKLRTRLFIALILSALTISYVLFLLSFPQEVEILYFRNDKCPIVKTTDVLIDQATAEFGDKISVRIIDAQLYPTEPNDTEEIKQLREKYGVIGLPDIIINGKKFSKKFTRTNLFAEICNNFMIKPEVCR